MLHDSTPTNTVYNTKWALKLFEDWQNKILPQLLKLLTVIIVVSIVGLHNISGTNNISR